MLKIGKPFLKSSDFLDIFSFSWVRDFFFFIKNEKHFRPVWKQSIKSWWIQKLNLLFFIQVFSNLILNFPNKTFFYLLLFFVFIFQVLGDFWLIRFVTLLFYFAFLIWGLNLYNFPSERFFFLAFSVFLFKDVFEWFVFTCYKTFSYFLAQIPFFKKYWDFPVFNFFIFIIVTSILCFPILYAILRTYSSYQVLMLCQNPPQVVFFLDFITHFFFGSKN